MNLCDKTNKRELVDEERKKIIKDFKEYYESLMRIPISQKSNFATDGRKIYKKDNK